MQRFTNTLEQAIELITLHKAGVVKPLEDAKFIKMFERFRIEKDTQSGASDWTTYTVYKGKYSIVYRA